MTAAQSTLQSDARRRALLIAVAGVIVLGLLARLIALTYAPRYSYDPDHMDFMAWSAYAYEHGPTQTYSIPRRTAILYRNYAARGRVADRVSAIPHSCNYPPLSTYIFWAQGWLWSVVQDEMPAEQLQVLLSRYNVPESALVSKRVANTFAARFVGALPSMLFDFLLAWGVARLVQVLRAAGQSRRVLTPAGRAGDSPAPLGWRECAAFATTLLAPPVFLDSAFWNQADSWAAALMVWTLVWLLRERFIAAGVIYGVSLLIKPQAIFLGPVFLLVLLALRFESGGTWRRAFRVVWMGLVALVVAGIASLPHTLASRRPADEASGEQGRRAPVWFERSYLDTVFGDMYPRITLNAFNVWWFKYTGALAERNLLQGINAKAPAIQVGSLRVSRDALGKGLLLASLLVSGWLCVRKWRWTREAWMAFAFLVTFAAFLLPTRVHERYIFFCIPFVVALAVHRLIWLPALVLLLIVGTAEMTSFRWAQPRDLADASVRGFSNLLAVLSVIAFLYAYAILIPRASAQEPQSPKRQRGHHSRLGPSRSS